MNVRVDGLGRVQHLRAGRRGTRGCDLLVLDLQAHDFDLGLGDLLLVVQARHVQFGLAVLAGRPGQVMHNIQWKLDAELSELLVEFFEGFDDGLRHLIIHGRRYCDFGKFGYFRCLEVEVKSIVLVVRRRACRQKLCPLSRRLL